MKDTILAWIDAACRFLAPYVAHLPGGVFALGLVRTFLVRTVTFACERFEALLDCLLQPAAGA